MGTPDGTTGNRVAIGLYTSGTTTVYVLDSAGNIRTSTDDGNTWSTLLPPPPAGAYTDMSIDPNTGRIFIAVGDGTTHYWRPGDASWTTIAGPGVADVRGIAWIPALVPEYGGAIVMLPAIAAVALPLASGRARRK